MGDLSALNINGQTLIKRPSITTKLYVFSYSIGNSSVHEYDVGLYRWKDITPPTPKRGTLNNLEKAQEMMAYDVYKIILIGLKSLSVYGTHSRVRVQSLDITSGEIRELAPMLSSRVSFSAVLFGKEIFVFGGTDEDARSLSTAEK